jgi:hypothetical protein
MKRNLHLWLLVAVSLNAFTASPPPGRPVPVPNGASSVDFNADGKLDLIVSAHRENFNAHSFEVVTFYIYSDDVGHPGKLHIVPVARADKESQEIMVSGGADCVLHDFRLLAGPAPGASTLILADRDFGDTYASREKVTFTYFQLQKNAEGIPGDALYAFIEARTASSAATYCDVGEAFKKELHL